MTHRTPRVHWESVDTQRSRCHTWLQMLSPHFPSGKLVTFLKNNRYSQKNSANKFMLKISKRHAGIRCRLFSKLARKILERCHWCHMDVFTANYKHIPQLALVFWLLTLTSVEWYFKIEIKTAVASF